MRLASSGHTCKASRLSQIVIDLPRPSGAAVDPIGMDFRQTAGPLVANWRMGAMNGGDRVPGTTGRADGA